MNPRERLLAIGLLGLIVLGGGFFMFYQFFLVPLRLRDASIASIQQEIDEKQLHILEVLADQPKLTRWRQLSLPADPDLARREYGKYLGELLRASGFAPGTFNVTPKPIDAKGSPTLPGRKEPIYTRLTYNILGHADLASVTNLLERFYRTPLLHQITDLSLQKPQTTGDQQGATELSVNLTIEALVLSGAQDRTQLLPVIDRRLLAVDAVSSLQQGPAGLGLMAWTIGPTGPMGPRLLAQPPRDYAVMAGKNIFFGPTPIAPRKDPEADPAHFIHLTDISRTEENTEAFLYDRYNNQQTRLRMKRGFDSFRIPTKLAENSLEAHLLRIGDRDLYFQVGESIYRMHVGQNVAEAMSRRLGPTEVQALGMSEESKRKGK